MSLPAVMRNQLVERGLTEIYALRHYNLPCIECCDWEYLDDIQDLIDSMDQMSDEALDLTATYISGSVPSPWDSTGRLTLPSIFLDHANIGPNATFVGVGKTFQIWNPEAYEAYNHERMDGARQRGISLNFNRIRSRGQAPDGGTL